MTCGKLFREDRTLSGTPVDCLTYPVGFSWDDSIICLLTIIPLLENLLGGAWVPWAGTRADYFNQTFFIVYFY